MDVAKAQNSSQNWIWKIWGHNPEKKLVEITYLIDNEEDLRKGIEFIESMGSMYSFIVDNVNHEVFQVMEEASRLTNAPLELVI
ncbi:MAG: YdhR family protein [Promethearchaeota archaeon]